MTTTSTSSSPPIDARSSTSPSGSPATFQVAQEHAQEELVRSRVHWRRIHSYDDPAACARRVTRNLAASHSRHLRRAPTAAAVLEVAGPTDDHLALVAALRQLPRSQREAVVMHDGLGVPVHEVAAELGVPEGL